MKFLVSITTLCLLIACGNTNKVKKDINEKNAQTQLPIADEQIATDNFIHYSDKQLENYITGMWEDVKFSVFLYNQDSIVSFNRQSSRNSTGFSKRRTNYKTGGMYIEQSFNLDGNLVLTAMGKWYTRNDSLFTHQLTPIDATANYHVIITPDGNLLLNAQLDWAGDNSTNDIFEGIKQRFIVNNTKK